MKRAYMKYQILIGIIILSLGIGGMFYIKWRDKIRTEKQKELQVNVNTPEGITSKSNTLINQTPDISENNLYAEYNAEWQVPEKNLDFEQFESLNPDIYAWIYIPGTKVDYPVLQHPTDDTYYLNHNVDESKGYPGCIYSELCNNKDFNDIQTVLYGHNMKDTSMFGSLYHFKDIAFFSNYKYIYIYTKEKVYVYQIFAAYEYGNTHLVYGFDFLVPEIFLRYVTSIYEMDSLHANIDRNIDIMYGNKLLTLSTCVTDKQDRRFLVQGVLLNE